MGCAGSRPHAARVAPGPSVASGGGDGDPERRRRPSRRFSIDSSIASSIYTSADGGAGSQLLMQDHARRIWLDGQRDVLVSLLLSPKGRSSFRDYFLRTDAATVLALHDLARSAGHIGESPPAARVHGPHDVLRAYTVPTADKRWRASAPPSMGGGPAPAPRSPTAHLTPDTVASLHKLPPAALRLLAFGAFDRYLRSAHAAQLLRELSPRSPGGESAGASAPASEGAGSSGAPGAAPAAPAAADVAAATNAALHARLRAAVHRVTLVRDTSADGWRVRLEAALEQLPVGVTVSDAKDSSEAGAPILYANAAFEALTGYSRADCEGRAALFLLGSGGAAGGAAGVGADVVKRALLAGGGTALRHRVPAFRRDGTSFEDLVALKPVRAAAPADDADGGDRDPPTGRRAATASGSGAGRASTAGTHRTTTSRGGTAPSSAGRAGTVGGGGGGRGPWPAGAANDSTDSDGFATDRSSLGASSGPLTSRSIPSSGAARHPVFLVVVHQAAVDGAAPDAARQLLQLDALVGLVPDEVPAPTSATGGVTTAA